MAKSKIKVNDEKQAKSPEPGVYITRAGDTEQVTAFIGDNYEAQLTPSGDVAVLELVPDLSNDNGGKPIPVMRRLIASGVWEDVVVV